METVDEVDPTFVTQFLTGGMTFTTKKIMRGWLTPELAEQLLKRNPHNRTMQPNWVTMLARQMSAGRWQENGETIIVGKSGNLLDGQHRLQAVIQSGVSIMAIIVFGVDDDEAMVMASINQCKVRTVTDILKLSGHQVSLTTKAASNLLASLTEGDHLRKTRPEQAEFLLNHVEELEPWVDWADGINKASPLIERKMRRSRSISASTLTVLSVHMERRKTDIEGWSEFIEGCVGELPLSRLRQLSDNRADLLHRIHKRLHGGIGLESASGGVHMSKMLAEMALYVRVYNLYAIDKKPNGRLRIYNSDLDYRFLTELPAVEERFL